MAKKDLDILWLRQDLRLKDNPALNALAGSDSLAVVFINDDVNSGEHSLGGASKLWLHQSLDHLDEKLGGNISFFSGDAIEIFKELTNEYAIRKVCWNRCYEPWRVKRDKKIKEQLRSNDIEVESFKSDLLWEPWEVLKDDGTPYKVFTPYYKRCLKNRKLLRKPETKKLKAKIKKLKGAESLKALDLMPKIPWHKDMHDIWEPGEEGASKQFKRFLKESISSYKEGRDFPAKNSLSRLSPHLHFGEISTTSIWKKITEGTFAANEEHFLRELCWREFSYLLLFHFNDLPRKNLNPKFDKFPWKKKSKHYDKWCRGQTGIPMIDAGMRELWQTGYMHNRVRMLVGSFLVKNLLLDWRLGEKWFWDTLFDADLANNSASWQWVAGSGADAAPYFRIFNPVTQGEKFDADGEYLKQFVPELAKMPKKYLHKPWEAPMDVLLEAGVKLGEDYPHPIVDIKESREEALDAYEEIKAKKD